MNNYPKDIDDITKEMISLKKSKNKIDLIQPNKEISKINLVVKIIIDLFSGIAIGMSIGYILDNVFDKQKAMLIVFTIIGCFSGMLNVYRSLKNMEKMAIEKDMNNG